jgi:hypothetical protein
VDDRLKPGEPVPSWAILEEIASIQMELDRLQELTNEDIEPEDVGRVARRLEWLCWLWLRQVEGL